jgi:hypothetical protein
MGMAKANGAVKKDETSTSRLPADEAKVVNQELRVAVKCKGITPLLMNPQTQEALLKMRDKVKAPKNAPKPTPEQEAQQKADVYKDTDGNYYIPAEALYAALMNAGQFIRLDGRRQVSTAKSTLLPGLMALEDARLVLEGLNKEQPFEVDIKAGKNPNGGEAVCIVRPRFDEWEFTAHITIYTSEIGEELIRELFDKAGRRCGLLDFRPNRKGIFGQFVVEDWKRLS